MIQSEKYLPIGTLVKIDSLEMKVMIIGYASVDKKNMNKIYDYCGCIYPEGIITSERNILFDHNEIKEVFELGYSDEEQINWNNKMKSLLTKEQTGVILQNLKKGQVETLE